MINTIFDPNNLVWRGISRLVDIVGLSLFWLLLSFPIITIVPASTALYQVVVKAFRQGEDRTFRPMWKLFVENLKKQLPLSVIVAIMLVGIRFGYITMAKHTDTGIGAIMFVAYEVMLILPIGWIIYLTALLARFEDSIKTQVMTALVLEVKHLPSTIILVLLNIELLSFTLQKVFPVTFIPVIAMLLSSLFLEKIFLKHVDDDGEAKLKGITIEELMAEKQKALEKKNKKHKN